jgi:uncharacterized membrane protein
LPICDCRFEIVKRVAIAVVPAALAALAIAAPFLADSPWLAISIRRFFSVVCHQDPARSFWIAGAPVAVCVRCLGIYLGAAVGSAGVLRACRPRLLRIFIAALAVNTLDIVVEWSGLHGNLPGLRFALGLLAGVAIGALVQSSLRDSRPYASPATAEARG